MKNTPVKNEGQFAEQKIKEILNDESVKLYRVDGYKATQSYLAINREKRQFDIYSVTFKKIESENDGGKVKVLDEVYQTDTIPYENLKSAEVDKFAMVAHFTFNNEEIIKITNLSDNIKRFMRELNELGIATNLLERKWYNKILGFRTKKKWKMTIAAFAYLMLITAVAGMLTGDEEPAQEEVVASEESTEESIEESTADEKERQEEEEQKKLEEEKAEQETKEKEEAEKKAAEEERVAKEEAEKEEAKTPLTPKEEIENIIANVVGKDKITELNVEEADGSYEVDLTYAASENFTTDMTASGIKRNMVDIALKLQESEHYVSYLLMAATLPLTDSTGNTSDGEVMTVSFYGETIEQLNPDNEVFLYDNLERATDGYSAHPDFR